MFECTICGLQFDMLGLFICQTLFAFHVLEFWRDNAITWIS